MTPAKRPAWLTYLPWAAFLGDAAIITADMLLGVVLRAHLPVFQDLNDISSSLVVVGPLTVLGCLVMTWAFGGYRAKVFDSGPTEYQAVVRGTLATAFMLSTACYLAKFQLSRGFFVFAFIIGPVALVLWRWLLRRALHRARAAGLWKHRVLIAGTTGQIDDLASSIARAPDLGYQVTGCLTPPNDIALETPGGIAVLGNIDDATAVALDQGTDIIILAGAALSSSYTRTLAWELESHAVDVLLAPGLREVSTERIQIRPVAGIPLVEVESPRSAHARKWGKRAFDIVMSSLLIVAFSPVLAIAALRIKLHDGGPVLFRQQRIGRDAEEFTCLKFRTMVTDAESLVADLQAEQGASALLFKMKDDPRITAPGRWLRKYSVDELPQLFNVWRGSMSLVGPRPQVAAEVALYDDAMVRRLRVLPGMTGLWQVSGRSDLSAEEAIRLDLYYVDNWSMIQDLSILARTLSAVLNGGGAY